MSEEGGERRDALAILAELRHLLEQARAVPLSASVLVARDEVLALVEEVMAALPDELAEARWLVREREQFLARASLEAEAILDAARKQAEALVSHTEIVRAAEHEAARIVLDAKERASRLRMQTEDFIDRRLAAVEIALEELLAATRRGRERLAQGQPVPASEALAPGREDVDARL
jgi:cell division septum initiation protein DivIVA